MFSLRSISLFALACTAITSAAPTVNVVRRGFGLSGVLESIFGGTDSAASGANSPGANSPGAYSSGAYYRDLTTSPLPRGEPHKSFPDIFNAAHTGLGPIVASLEADIKIADKIDADAVVGHLNLVVVLLADVLADVSVVVKTDGYLVSNGVKLTVDVVAKIIFDVLAAVFVILQAVIKVVVDVRVGPIIVEIGAKLVAILKAVVIIDVGLQASLAVLVKAVVEAVAVLKFNDILVVLGIKA